MYDHNQLFVADSFTALYSVNGRPTLSRPELETRYELCEDLAQHVGEFNRTLQFSQDLSEDAALRKCLDGLLAPPTSVSATEAAWVVRRVAELLSWKHSEWLGADAGA